MSETERRKAAVRALPWGYLGFLIGFASEGNNLIADFGYRIGNGLAWFTAIYLFSMVCYAIFKPKENGKKHVFERPSGIIVGAVVAIVVAGVLPVLLSQQAKKDNSGHFVYDDAIPKK